MKISDQGSIGILNAQAPNFKNSALWNIGGQVLILATVLWTLPSIVHGLGVVQYGHYVLLSAVFIYSIFLDFGLGSALVYFVAEKVKANDFQNFSSLFWTSMLLLLVFGMIGSAVIMAVFPWVFAKIIKIPPGLYAETQSSIVLIALGIPFVVINSGLRSIFCGLSRFDFVNIIQTPIICLNYIGIPVLLLFTKRLDHLMLLAVASQVLMFLIFAFVLFRKVPFLGRNIVLSREQLDSLLAFGGWITVSNTVGVAMTYIDRFVIAAMVSLYAVTYYVVPFDIISKVFVLASALCAPLIPLITKSAHDGLLMKMHFLKALTYLYLAVFPIVLALVVFSMDILSLWMGGDIAQHSHRVMLVLVVSVFINSLALVPFNFLLGQGRPGTIAKLHLVETPVYFLMLWVLIRKFGIEGAALAWGIRVAVDALILFVLSARTIDLRKDFYRLTYLLLSLFLLVYAVNIDSFKIKVIYTAAVMVVFAMAAFNLMIQKKKGFQPG